MTVAVAGAHTTAFALPLAIDVVLGDCAIREGAGSHAGALTGRITCALALGRGFCGTLADRVGVAHAAALHAELWRITTSDDIDLPRLAGRLGLTRRLAR